MRAIGLDESALAGNYSRLLNRVDEPENEKLHLETLKEFGKLLDAYPVASHAAGNDPVPVQLVHSVPRPARPETSSEGKEAT